MARQERTLKLPKENLAMRCLTVIMTATGYLIGGIVILLNLIVLAGIAVVILKFAFGVEWFNDFDWLLPNWFQKMFIH